MKKWILIVLFGSIYFNAIAQEFKFEQEVIDFGKVVKGADGTRYFKFTNVGEAPILIDSIQTSCDCTIPKYPKKPIMPGQKDSIQVHYDTNKVGGFAKNIYILSNAVTGRKKIKIKGYIIQ